MRLSTPRTWPFAVALSVMGMAASPVLAQDVFGPETYVRTTGAQDVYTDTFTFGAAATLPLWIQNGDDEGHRVSSGSVVVNGQTVLTPADLSQQTHTFRRPVPVTAGTNTVTVTLAGEPGSYLTLWIPHPDRHGRATAGRVLLPYGNAFNLVLDLKNGSHEHARAVRILFYDPSGQAVAASARIPLPPRASLSVPALQLIAQGSWTNGSIEVFYAGPGFGRVLGQAVDTDAHTGISSIVPLQPAGHRRLEHRASTTAPAQPSAIRGSFTPR